MKLKNKWIMDNFFTAKYAKNAKLEVKPINNNSFFRVFSLFRG